MKLEDFPVKWTVVQMMLGEPLSAVGPFETKEEADSWIAQHKATQPATEWASFFAVETVTPTKEG